MKLYAITFTRRYSDRTTQDRIFFLYGNNQMSVRKRFCDITGHKITDIKKVIEVE